MSQRITVLWLGVAAACAVAARPLAACAFTPAELDAAALVAKRGAARPTRTLASNRIGGRDNGTRESAAVQRYIVSHLKHYGAGLNSAARGDAAYRQPFVENGQRGTNLVAVLRGRELPDEYVFVGGHYDHLGTRSDAQGHCSRSNPPGGEVCNGATDNAAGTAAVLAIGRALRRLPTAPRRSVVLALWDAEEDSLLGSLHYVNNPLVPLAQTVAYVNLDVLGAVLLPSLRNSSFAVGSETGGAVLRAAVAAAAATEPALQLRPFSFVFGQLRSDYANFVAHDVPTVFFADSTGGCYHTVGDDISIVDFPKLGRQSAVAFRTTVALAEQTEVPSFAPANPNLAVYEDAVSLGQTLDAALPDDLPLFDAAAQKLITSSAAQVEQMLADGPDQFDGPDIITVLTSAAALINELTEMGCRRY